LSIELDIFSNNLNSHFVCRIQESKVKDILKRMKRGKTMGLDWIPIEVLRSFRDVAIIWFTKLFKLIFQSNKMFHDWRQSILVPIFKNKRGGDCKVVLIIANQTNESYNEVER
jgi:c-di-AMP phosphodiesterase-like protein